ncbi:MAG: hypothetical protein JWL86_1010 [Rhizobium sp.]|nr:hypothetical protein [Rhizobium sp.]
MVRMFRDRNVPQTDAKNGTRILLDLALIAILGMIQTWFIVGDFDVRLSQPPIDESPVAHAYFFANPGDFALDAYMKIWSHVAMSSAINWLPAFALKYLTVPPELFFALFTLLQTAALGCTSYYFALVAFNSRGVGWLSAVFIFMWRPHWVNLALVGGLDWMPYANWMTLPFLILAAAWVIQGRLKSSVVSLAAGALIHPIMAVIATLFVAAYVVTERNIKGRTLLLGAVVGLTVCVVGYIPAAISTSGLTTAAPPLQAGTLLANAHIYPPGAGYPFGVAALVNGLIWTVAMFMLALSGSAGASRQSRWFLVCAGSITAATCALHVFSVLVLFAPVLNLILTRSSIVLLLLCVPFVMSRLACDLGSASPIRIIASLTLLFSCSTLSLIGVLALTPPDAGAGTKGGIGKVLKWAGGAVSILTSTIVLARHVPGYSGRIDETLLFWMDGTIPWLLSDNRAHLFSWKLFIGSAAAVTLASILVRSSWGENFVAQPKRTLYAVRFAVLAVASSMIVAMSSENAATGVQETTGIARDYYDAQLWARDHSPRGSAFINAGLVPLAWRGVSHRQTIVTYGVGTVYLSTVEAQDYNTRMADFKTRNLTDASETWEKLDENQWRDFKSKFGGDYLVRKAAWNSLAFPIAYANPSFVIYKLDP